MSIGKIENTYNFCIIKFGNNQWWSSSPRAFFCFIDIWILITTSACSFQVLCARNCYTSLLHCTHAQSEVKESVMSSFSSKTSQNYSNRQLELRQATVQMYFRACVPEAARNDIQKIYFMWDLFCKGNITVQMVCI